MEKRQQVGLYLLTTSLPYKQSLQMDHGSYPFRRKISHPKVDIRDIYRNIEEKITVHLPEGK
jgi:hypothetical protein